MSVFSGRALGWLAMCCLGGVVSSAAFAQGLELKASEIRGQTDTKEVSVLQNRYFLKAWRPELGVGGGAFINEAYTSTTAWGARFSLFPSEWFGVEAQYLKTNVADSADRKALNQIRRYKTLEDAQNNILTTIDPEFNPIRQVIDTNVVMTPFYGKLNLVDLLIVYTDLYLSLGVSRLETDQGPKTGVLWGVGERFYLARWFSLRADFRVRSFTETRAGMETNRNAMSVDFGASVFLW
jgi:outer membrane beta-barrel protein